MTSQGDRDFDALLVTAEGAEPGDVDTIPAHDGAAAARAPRQMLRLDAWWGRVLATPARRRAWAWGGPLLVTLLAAALRLWDLGRPGSLVFDETYYVKDAWSLWNLGHEPS
jgi:dolichyl-phosphate-mannose-protein mannosyltransferase